MTAGSLQPATGQHGKSFWPALSPLKCLKGFLRTYCKKRSFLANVTSLSQRVNFRLLTTCIEPSGEAYRVPSFWPRASELPSYVWKFPVLGSRRSAWKLKILDSHVPRPRSLGATGSRLCRSDGPAPGSETEALSSKTQEVHHLF